MNPPGAAVLSSHSSAPGLHHRTTAVPHHRSTEPQYRGTGMNHQAHDRISTTVRTPLSPEPYGRTAPPASRTVPCSPTRWAIRPAASPTPTPYEPWEWNP